MAKKKARKKKMVIPPRKNKPKDNLKSNFNPNHKEDFDKVLQMLVPRIEPKAKK